MTKLSNKPSTAFTHSCHPGNDNLSASVTSSNKLHYPGSLLTEPKIADSAVCTTLTRRQTVTSAMTWGWIHKCKGGEELGFF